MRYGIIIAGIVAFIAVAAYTVLRSPDTSELERADGLFDGGGLSDDAGDALGAAGTDSGEADLAADIGAETEAAGDMDSATAPMDSATAPQTESDRAGGMDGTAEMQTANPDSSLAGGATEGVTPPTDAGTAEFQPGEDIAQGGGTETAGQSDGAAATDAEATETAGAESGGTDMTDPQSILAAEEEEAEPFERPQTATLGSDDDGATTQTDDAAATATEGSTEGSGAMQTGDDTAAAQGTAGGGMDDPGANPEADAYGDTAGTDPAGEELDTSTAEGPSAETLQSLSETGAASEKATAAAKSAADDEERAAAAAQDTAREAAETLGAVGAVAGSGDGGALAERVQEMEQRIEDSDLSGDRQRELLTALREVADDPEALREELERIAREADL